MDIRSIFPTMSNLAYDRLKFMALVVLPAFGSLYFGIAQIWGAPSGEEVVGTIVLIDTFLGVLLGISSSQYQEEVATPDGQLVVNDAEDKLGIRMVLDKTPEELAAMDEVRFKVNRGEMEEH